MHANNQTFAAAEIVIHVVRGGFILEYPILVAESNTLDIVVTEVFSSPRKLNQKIKELVDTLSLVSDSFCKR